MEGRTHNRMATELPSVAHLMGQVDRPFRWLPLPELLSSAHQTGFGTGSTKMVFLSLKNCWPSTDTLKHGFVVIHRSVNIQFSSKEKPEVTLIELFAIVWVFDQICPFVPNLSLPSLLATE